MSPMITFDNFKYTFFLLYNSYILYFVNNYNPNPQSHIHTNIVYALMGFTMIFIEAFLKLLPIDK